MSIPRHIQLAVVASIVALFAFAPSAIAHQNVTGTSPGRNSTVAKSVKLVTTTFSGSMVKSGTLRVTGPGGTVYSIGRGGRDPRKLNRIRVNLKAGLPVGRFTVRWTIVAADGHSQSGSWSFRTRA